MIEIKNKGAKVMLIIVVAVILTVIAGVFVIGIFYQVSSHMGGMDMTCPTFCAVQSEIEEYGVLDVALPSFIPFVRDSSGAAMNMMADFLIRDQAMQCYCGVEEQSGKYIHVHNWDENVIGEFHITDQNPEIHLQYHVIDTDGNVIISHRDDRYGAYEVICNKALEQSDGFETLRDLEFYDGCVMFSVNTNQNGEDLYLPNIGEVLISTGCRIYGFNENTTISNEMKGQSIWGSVDGENKELLGEATIDEVADDLSEKLVEENDEIKNVEYEEDDDEIHITFQKGDLDETAEVDVSNKEWDVVRDLEVGEEVAMEGKNPEQRMLLQEYREGVHTYGFYAPVTCVGSTREDNEDTETPLDKMCRMYCEDQEEVFVDASCMETMRGQYERLGEEYRHEDMNLCPRTDEKPYCICEGQIHFQWEIS